MIVSAKIGDVDVFSLLAEDDEVYCNFVRIRHGSIVGVYTVKLSPGVETDRAEMLTLAIQHIVEYRHFNVKTVVGADDFASMREIVGRRYRRLLDEGAELPDLIVVDGGKGQLSSAYAVLCELGIEDRVPVVGLAKRIEEVFYPNDPMPYYLSRTGEPLKVICHLRDEAHRFGITFHRQKRSANFIRSELEQIEGIGPKSIETLLRHFRTVARVGAASREELTALVGAVRAERIYDFFHTRR